MHSVLIVIHLLVAAGLVALILLQRSEGGALGMGGGPGGLMSGRAAGSMLTRATSGLALVFFITSITLTIFSGAGREPGSILDRVNPSEIGAPIPSDTGDLLAPPASGPAAPAPAEEPAPAPDQGGEAPEVPIPPE